MTTVREFINHQVITWGEEYIDDLIDRNFVPTLTSAGWRWIYVDDGEYSSHVERIAVLDTAS